MHAHVPALEHCAVELIAQGAYNEALSEIIVGVHNRARTEAYAHRFLYFPGLDAQLEALAARLPEPEALPAPPGAETPPSLILATEVHRIGGHSAVIRDLIDELPNPWLVLTDVFWLCQKQPDHLAWVQERYAGARIFLLRQPSPWAKCQELATLIRALRPRAIWHLTHHEDAIGWVGSRPRPGCAGPLQVLAHHADHHPSLGNTLPGVAHADFTPEIAALCQAHLGQLAHPPHLLPLYVHDHGGPRARSASDFQSTVTAGNQIKYAREGEFALKRIAATVLRSLSGRFFHIGPLEAAWQAEIRDHLRAEGLEPERFVALGWVESVWKAVQSLPAGIFLASAPVPGGLSTAEAQGAGLPVVFHSGRAVVGEEQVHSIFASPELAWRSLDELPAALGRVVAEPERLGAAAREHYDAHNSRAVFRQAIRVLGPIA
jgi:hypothetical protein